MLHRVLGHWDYLMVQVEFHYAGDGVFCPGASSGIPFVATLCNPGGHIAGSFKINSNIRIGMISTHPVGLGHDGGPLRSHALVCTDVTINPVTSIVETITNTAKSAVKPKFSSHKLHLEVGGSNLPACLELLPLSISSVSFCGNPDSINAAPFVPTHLSVFSSMSWGDIVGGLVDFLVDQVWSIVSELTISKIFGGFGGLIRKVLSRYAPELAKTSTDLAARGLGDLIGSFPGMSNRVGGGRLGDFLSDLSDGDVNWGFGPSNIGVLVQRGIDQDSVEHDADAKIAFAFWQHTWR